MENREIYFSVDVETDGPIPGPHSMLSFGAAAFLPDGTLVGTFEANLHLLRDAKMHPDTEKFWKQNPEAYAKTRIDLKNPLLAMEDFVNWVKRLCFLDNGKHWKPVFVAYPAGFDFMFMYWYMIEFAGESPFSFSALDIKSYAMAKLDLPYREATKRNMPKKWFSKKKHTHVAIDDAIEQGELFINMLKDKS